MKKLILFTLALAGSCIAAKAQKPDTARLLIHYQFTHIRDTTNRANPYTENMVLFAGKNASAYRSDDAIRAEEQFKKAYLAEEASPPVGQPRTRRRGGGSALQYYQYPNDKKLITKDRLQVVYYFIESAIPAIQWKISSDTATFGGLHCQKATCYFKGRDYIAWFCPDLPLRTGPWQLNGLPGLIVDARDVKNEVIFKFAGIEKVVLTPRERVGAPGAADKDLSPELWGLNADPKVIEPQLNAIKATQKEFDRLKDMMFKDPDAFERAILANVPNQPDMPKRDPGRVAGKINTPPVWNNPIELPEK